VPKLCDCSRVTGKNEAVSGAADATDVRRTLRAQFCSEGGQALGSPMGTVPSRAIAGRVLEHFRSSGDREGSIVPGITATNPLDLYYMPYTHSLDGALLWSVGAGIVYYFLRRKDGSTGASLVGGAVFSHWMLDVLVHRPDMPLYDNSAKIGLGLWNHPLFAFVLEVAVLFGGMYSYLRSTDAMLLVQAFVFFGPPPSSATGAAITALVFYFGFAGMAGWLEKERVLSLGQREKWLAK
jgi:hypothetical protein